MKLQLLSAKNYSGEKQDYGDCILIYSGSPAVVFDCGSVEHAQRVEKIMKSSHCSQIIAVLSHNDLDHFAGFPYLAERGLISHLYTPLFMKHLDELLKLLDDGRRTRDGLKRTLLQKYNNVTKLAQDYNVSLVDSLTATSLVSGVSIVGPSKEYALNAAATGINGSVSDTLDGETFVNAASVQVSVELEGKKCLLCGDSSFPAIESKIRDYELVQLPHHGKLETAESIFHKKKGQVGSIYLVSDNKGDATGGSDSLMKNLPKGYIIKNTKNGDIYYPSQSPSDWGVYTGHSLGKLWW